MNEKIKELFSNEEFVAKMMDLETAEEVQALLAENGVELSMEEINQLRVAVGGQMDGELDEDALENVAGGSSFVKDTINAFDEIVKVNVDYFVHLVRRRW